MQAHFSCGEYGLLPVTAAVTDNAGIAARATRRTFGARTRVLHAIEVRVGV
jgi:hypothetical protein